MPHPSPKSLASILSLEEIGADFWRAWSPLGRMRDDIFGGQVAGQALRAAGLTVGPDRLPNSVHGYFLRRGQAALPLELFVERVRDGRNYTSRRVDVRQEGRTIFAMLASFHVGEPGAEYDHVMPTGVPRPEALPAADPAMDWLPAVEVRHVDVEGPQVRWWGRLREPLPPDPLLHCAALLYASDLRAGGAAMAAVGWGWPRPAGDDSVPRIVGSFGSLDHALWFHRIPEIDDWIFCTVRAMTVRDARGLVVGELFAADGRHLATFTQEVFMRPAGPA
jgi:acyl-CoA thioesterase II